MPPPSADASTASARRAVARGQALFNMKAIAIRGVKGVASLNGTCTTCHDTPGGGNHSIPAPLDIGVADASRATPDMPLYVLRNLSTGEKIATTQPGAVVDFYNVRFSIGFTDQEKSDLAAFLRTL